MNMKEVNKHLFFVSKGLNWGDITPERQVEYARKYVFKTCKQVGKLQDFQRLNVQSPPVTAYQVISNALEVKAIA